MGVSIVLCFYNGGKKLIPTLEHIKKLDIAGVPDVELILVDNNSNDDSDEIIRAQMCEFKGFAWKVVFQPDPGLSRARDMGIKEAKNDIILFCDDDNWLAADYLKKGYKIIQSDAKIAVLGGKGTAISSNEMPQWFKGNEVFYATGAQRPQSGQITENMIAVYGAGMFMRKSAFFDIINRGFAFYNLGRTGKKLSAGEDTEMCLAFHIAGYKIWYDAGLEFFHFIDEKRLDLKVFEKIKMGIYRSRYIARFYLDYIQGYVPKVSKYFWLKEFIFSLKDLFLSLFNVKRQFEIKRNFDFSKYLLKERSRYNENVNKIVTICKSLDKKNEDNPGIL